jgi:BlaI family transcriptional regulator, penicillinase repressor
MPRGPKPTDSELAVLRVLWERGASTVREVHESMAEERTIGYTTTLKRLQVMTEKGLTHRESHRGQHLYSATHAEVDTQRHLLADLLDRAFGGSTSKLVIQALTSRPASPGDLREIRRLLATPRRTDKRGGRS